MGRIRMLQGLAVLGWFAGAPALASEEPEQELPGDAFLEFLGGFETADGDWVDPVSLAELDAAEALPDGVDGQERDEKDDT